MAKKQDLKEMIKDLETKKEDVVVDDVIEDTIVDEQETLEDIIDAIEGDEGEVFISIINFAVYGYTKKDINSTTSNFAQMASYKAIIEEEVGDKTWIRLIDCGVYVLLDKKEYVIC